MSSDLMRACLRMSAVAALRNATAAEARVWDSSIASLDGADLSETRPLIIVFTEQEDGEMLGTNGGPPFRPIVELVLQVSMAMVVEDPKAAGVFSITNVETDGELELALDMICAQVEQALWRGMSLNAQLFRKAAIRAHHKQSMRATSPKDGTRLALRYQVYKIEMDDTGEIPFQPGLTGADCLPEPFSTICKQWPDGTPEKANALALADGYTGVSFPPFKGVDLHFSVATGDNNTTTPATVSATIDLDGDTTQ